MLQLLRKTINCELTTVARILFPLFLSITNYDW